MSILKGDFIGFTYNGVHSSTLGIARYSGGTRYKDTSLPTFQDKTVQIPGGDGVYYFGSQYTNRQIDINIAFDELTDLQYHKITQLFGDRQIHDLIFDELPYKVYHAKVSVTPNFNTICFDDAERGCRIYKGEGTISFVCYNPFATSRYKYREDYITKNIAEWTYSQTDSELDLYDDAVFEFYNNLDEWIESSGIRIRGTDQNNKLDTYIHIDGSNPFFRLYNPGDIETDWLLYIPFDEGQFQELIVSLNGKNETTIKLDEFSGNDNEIGIIINSRTNLIEGIRSIKTNEGGDLTSYEKSGIIYNRYIMSGNFFKIPLGNSTLNLNREATNSLIKYDYLYF